MSDPEATTTVEGVKAPEVPAPAETPATPDARETPAEAAAPARNKARDAAIRAAGLKLMRAFQGPDLGVGPKQAAILTAHIAGTCKNLTEFAGYGRTQALDWAQKLRHLNPVAWTQLLDANIEGFVAALRLANARVARKPLGEDAERGDEHDSDVELYEEFTAVLSAP